MKIFAILIISLIVGTLLKSNSKDVLSLQTSIEPTVTVTVTETPSTSPKPTVKLTNGTSQVSVNSNVHIVNNGTGDAGKVKVTVTGADWTYPGSDDDSAAVVTEWFVNKIKSQGLSTTSFVKTSANGHVMNCLVAGSQVKIQISQNSDASCQW